MVVYDVILKSAGVQKVAVITLLKERTGLGLKDAKELVDQATTTPTTIIKYLSYTEAEALKHEFENTGAIIELTPTPDVSTDNNYAVFLISPGTQNKEVEALLAESIGIDQKEAKELMNNAPTTVLEHLSFDKAKALKNKLSEIGARAILKTILLQTITPPIPPPVPTPGPPPGPIDNGEEYAVALIYCVGGMGANGANPIIWDIIDWNDVTFVPDISGMYADAPVMWMSLEHPTIIIKDIKTTDHNPDIFLSLKPSSDAQTLEEEKLEIEILWKNDKGEYRRTTPPDPNMHIWGVHQPEQPDPLYYDTPFYIIEFCQNHSNVIFSYENKRIQGITKAEAEELLDLLVKNEGKATLLVWDGEWMVYQEPHYPEDLTDEQKPTAKKLVYNGSEQELVAAPLELLPGYTIMYKLHRYGDIYRNDIPTYKDAGDYTIKVRYKGDSNHTDFEGEDIKVTIEKAPLTITPDAGQSKKFGKDDPDLTYSQIPATLYAKEDKLCGALSRAEGEDVGEYEIRKGKLDAGKNYDISFTPGVTFEITKADPNYPEALTASQKPTANPNLVYNGLEQELVTAPEALIIGYTIKYKLTSANFFDTGIPTAKDAGTYTIKVLYKGDSNHTDFNCEDIEVTIKKAPLTITPTANQSKKFGEDDPDLTYTQIPAKLYAKEDKLDGALSRAEGENVGKYEIRIGSLNAGDNYEIKLTPGIKFEITQADPNYPEALTSGQKPTANQNLVYNGKEQDLIIKPAESLPDYTVKYAIKPYNGTAIFSTALPTAKNANTYIVQVRYEGHGNHITFDGEDIKVTIKQALLTITPDAGQSKKYGEDDPELRYSQVPETLYATDELTGKLGRIDGEKPGTYDFCLNTLKVNSYNQNYDIKLNRDVKFEITKADPPILTDKHKPTANKNLVYNGSNQNLVLRPSTSLPGYDIKYKFDNATDYNSIIPKAKDAGTYTINVQYKGDNNHTTFEGEDIIANIEKAPLTITPTANQSKKFGEDDPDLTYTQIPATLYAKEDKLGGALSRAEGEDVGEYDILVGNLSAGDNYDITFTSGVKFAITEADIPEPNPEPWPDPESEPDPTPGPTPGPIDNGEEYAVALVYCEGGMWSNPIIWDMINWNDVTFVPDITDMYADAPVMWMSLEHPTIFVKDIKTTDHDPNIFFMHQPSSEEEKVEIEILWKNAKGEYRRTTPPDPNMHIWGVRTKQETWSQSQNEKIDEFRSKYPNAFISQYAPRVQGITKAEAEELLDLLTKTKGKYEMLVWDGEWMKYSDKNNNYINMNNYNDLIPIKGISIAMKKALGKKSNIYDVGGLLSKGRTLNDRYAIAKDLGIEEVRYVTLWLKQADLWRISDMTPDDAYMLVLAGVRNISDLAKVDIEKLMPVLETVVASHPDLPNPERNRIEKHISVAQTLESLKKNNPAIAPYALIVDEEKEPTRLFKSGITKQNLRSDAQIINEGLRKLNDISVSLPLPRTISGHVKLKKDGSISDYSDIKVELTGITSPAESAHETPSLFAYSDATGYFSIVLPDKYNMQPTLTFTLSQGGNKQQFIKQASEVIDKTYIPNGAMLNGKVMYAKDLISKFNDFDSINTGIATINHCLETLEKISEEKFELELKYDESKKEESEALKEELEALNKYKNEILKDCLETLEKIWKEVFHTAFEYKVEDLTEDRLQELLEKLKQYRNEILKEIFGTLIDEDDLELSLTNLLSHTDLDSDIGDLIINFSVFMGIFNEKPKALPSVKLMGEDDKAIKLPTDTAPSRVFNYTMLQRLVEPSITTQAETDPNNTSNNSNDNQFAETDPNNTSNNSNDNQFINALQKQRNALQAPIDVTSFKIDMAEHPNRIPKMSSLGIGYTLKMHQAWVPDGFALGTLLYSTILAPGEEQRLVLRESTQSYQVLDEAEGSDVVSEDYATMQDDDATATYNYAVNQLMTGESSMDFSVKSNSVGLGFGVGGGYSGNGGDVGGSLGLSFGHSKTSGSASSSARQSNSHDEASSAAQSFQHCIKTASERISQAKRISMRSATSNEKDSLATRIIANHNHSHAMTIQYWEVVRRYKLETCIDGVDLVLFVPFDLIHFLPQGQPFYLKLNATENDPSPSVQGFNKEKFTNRYDTLLKHYDLLSRVLPSKYRSGLNLIQRYATYPEWRMEQVIQDESSTSSKPVLLSITGKFLEYDNLKITVHFSNGRSPVAAQLVSTSGKDYEGGNQYDIKKDPYYLNKLIEDNKIRTTQELKDLIIEQKSGTIDVVKTFHITLPRLTTKDDIASIRIEYSCRPMRYTLYTDYELGDGGDVKKPGDWTESERKAIDKYHERMRWIYENNEDTEINKADLAHFYEGLPENYRVNEVNHGATLSSSVLKSLCPLNITDITLIADWPTWHPYQDRIKLSTYQLQMQYNPVIIETTYSVPVLRYDELQKMELTLHHVASETMRYSQIVWSRLTADERALLLEQYTVSLGSRRTSDREGSYYNAFCDKMNDIHIPLLNCINVKKVLGFYGNCMLFPFTYPQELAEQLGKTAAELQDALYRYHTSSFRVPSTVISLPTRGMIGEAVLGETNVSEEIDLTRFWNWQDSPIDKMEINENYLNGKDYLEGKTTKDISALNLQGVSPTTAVSVNDLIAALANKKTPEFKDLTNLEALNNLLENTTKTNSDLQIHALDNNTELMSKVLEYATEKAKTAANLELENTKQDTMKKAIENGMNPYSNTNNNTNNNTNQDPKADPKAGPKPNANNVNSNA